MEGFRGHAGQYNGVILSCPRATHVATVTKIWVYKHKIGYNSTCCCLTFVI